MAKPHSTIVRKNGKHIEGLLPDFKHLWHRSSVLAITQLILSANISQITQDLCKLYHSLIATLDALDTVSMLSITGRSTSSIPEGVE